MVQQNPFFTAKNIYGVFDGAAIPDLLEKLYQWQPEYICLYRGELAPDLAEVAPYLIKLDQEVPFTDWVLEHCWGNNWGIFAASDADILALRKHFRTFLMVENDEGKPVYFRYYDPRVFREYLPLCNSEESNIVFGPVKFYMFESMEPKILLRYTQHDDLPYKEEIRMG